ncbi:MAG TPA: hypothetical protein VK880_13595, partial [Anaerolineales bacterium]|nr:hypothetical protein [Anaerolineales bacterium]
SMSQKIISGVNNRYFNMWQKSLRSFFLGRTNRALIERYQERVKCFGYSLTDLEWIGPVVK